MAQIRDIPGNPGRVATLDKEDAMKVWKYPVICVWIWIWQLNIARYDIFPQLGSYLWNK